MRSRLRQFGRAQGRLPRRQSSSTTSTSALIGPDPTSRSVWTGDAIDAGSRTWSRSPTRAASIAGFEDDDVPGTLDVKKSNGRFGVHTSSAFSSTTQLGDEHPPAPWSTNADRIERRPPQRTWTAQTASTAVGDDQDFALTKPDTKVKISPLSPSSTFGSETLQSDDRVIEKHDHTNPFRVCPECASIIGSFFRSPSGAGFNRLWRHIFAFLLALTLGVAPMAIFLTRPGHTFSLATPGFSYDRGGCGPYGYQSDSAPDGAEALFTVDQAYGQMAFWQAKIVDILYDTFVGFGFQGIAWLISYRVFCDSLLRSIEAAPMPFRTFFALTLDTATFSSVRALIADFRRYSSKRIKARFLLIALCACYVLSIPTLFGAMTGYAPAQTAFMQVDDQNLVPLRDVDYGVTFVDGDRIGLQNRTCFKQYDTDGLMVQYLRQQAAYCHACNCVNIHEHTKGLDHSRPTHTQNRPIKDECKFCRGDRYSSASDWRYVSRHHYENYSSTVSACTESVKVTLHNVTYDLGDDPLHIDSYDKCYNNEPYSYSYIDSHGVCMQTTKDPVYSWGFSVTFTLVVLCLQFLWTLFTYILWLDADFHSHLVRRGYSMSEMKAVFALSAAAQRELDLSDIGAGSAMRDAEIERRLFKSGAAVSYARFASDLPFMDEKADGKSREKV